MQNEIGIYYIPLAFVQFEKIVPALFFSRSSSANSFSSELKVASSLVGLLMVSKLRARNPAITLYYIKLQI